MAETLPQYTYYFSRSSFGNYDAGPDDVLDVDISYGDAVKTGYYATSYVIHFNTLLGSPTSSSRQYNFNIQVLVNNIWYTLHEAKNITLYSGGSELNFTGTVSPSLQELIGKNGITDVRVYVLQDSGNNSWKIRGYRAGTGYIIFGLTEEYQAVDRTIYNPFNISVKDSNGNTVNQSEGGSTYPNSDLKICWRIGGNNAQYIYYFRITLVQYTTGNILKTITINKKTAMESTALEFSSDSTGINFTYNLFKENHYINESVDIKVYVESSTDSSGKSFISNKGNYYVFRIRDFGRPSAITDFKIEDKEDAILYIGAANVAGRNIKMTWTPATAGQHCTNTINYLLSIKGKDGILEKKEIAGDKIKISKGKCEYTYTTPSMVPYDKIEGTYSIIPVGTTLLNDSVEGDPSNKIQIAYMFGDEGLPSLNLGLYMTGNFNTYVDQDFTLHWNSVKEEGSDNRYKINYRTEILKYKIDGTTESAGEDLKKEVGDSITELTYTKEELGKLDLNASYGIRFSVIYTATFLGNQSRIVTPLLQFIRIAPLSEIINSADTIKRIANSQTSNSNSQYMYKKAYILFELNKTLLDKDGSNKRTIYYNVEFKKGSNGTWTKVYANWSQWNAEQTQMNLEINLDELSASLIKETIYFRLLFQDDRGGSIELSKMKIGDKEEYCQIIQISAPQVEISSVASNSYDTFQSSYKISDSLANAKWNIKYSLKIKSGENNEYEYTIEQINDKANNNTGEQTITYQFNEGLCDKLSSQNGNGTSNFLEALYRDLTINRNPRPSLIFEVMVSRVEMPECAVRKQKQFSYNLERTFSFGEGITIKLSGSDPGSYLDYNPNSDYVQEGQKIIITIPKISTSNKSYFRQGEKEENIIYMLYRDNKNWNVSGDSYQDTIPKADNDIILKYKIIANINYKNKTVKHETNSVGVKVARWTDQDQFQVINIEKTFDDDNNKYSFSGTILFPDKMCSSKVYNNLDSVAYELFCEKNESEKGLGEELLEINNIITNNYKVNFIKIIDANNFEEYLQGDIAIKVRITFKNKQPDIPSIIKTSQTFFIRAASVPLAIRDGRIGINVSSVNFNKEETAIKNSALKVFSAENSYTTDEEGKSVSAPVVEIEADSNITNPIFLRFLHEVSDTTGSKLKTADFYLGDDGQIHCDNFYYPKQSQTILNEITGEKLTLSFLEQVNTNSDGTVALKISNGGEGATDSKTIIGKVKGWDKVLCFDDNNIFTNESAQFNIKTINIDTIHSKGTISAKGTISTEGTISAKGTISAEGAVSTEKTISAKGTISTEGDLKTWQHLYLTGASLTNANPAIIFEKNNGETGSYRTGKIQYQNGLSLFAYRPNETAVNSNYWRFYLPTPPTGSTPLGMQDYEIITTQAPGAANGGALKKLGIVYSASEPSDKYAGMIWLQPRG